MPISQTSQTVAPTDVILAVDHNTLVADVTAIIDQASLVPTVASATDDSWGRPTSIVTASRTFTLTHTAAGQMTITDGTTTVAITRDSMGAISTITEA